MEYVFGTQGSSEILKTKGSMHTDLKGFHEIERNYPDQAITDKFRVVRKLDSKTDSENNCYDWYEIDNHYRTIDKSVPLLSKIEESKTDTENALCEQDAKISSGIEDIENAICEEDTTISSRISMLENAVCEMDSTLNQ